MTVMESDVYYDPYDFEIDSDPYPVWKRLRDERPLYYNERYDFYAVSRFDDVDRCSLDWETYVSSKGTVLELIKSGMELPPGSIIFEDPPAHHVHRRLLARVFTPRNINGLEPKIREFCARSLDPLVGAGGFDFIADLGAQMPMRTIGMLLGIPEADQEAIRDRIDEGLRLTEGGMPDVEDMYGDGRTPSTLRGVHRVAGEPPVGRPDDRAAPGRVRGRDRGHAPIEPPRGPLLREPPRGRGQRDDDAPDRVDGQGARRAPRPARGARRAARPRPEHHRGASALRVPVTGPGPLRHPRRRASRWDRAGRERARCC